MSFTAHELLQTYLGVAVGAVLFLNPGFCFAELTNFFAFRSRSAPERVLWSVALSTPLSLVIATDVPRLFGISATLLVFGLLAGVAAGLPLLKLRGQTTSQRTGSQRRAFRLALCFAAALAVVLPLLTADFSSGPHIFQSTVMYDWAVRVPMVRAALEGGVPPPNPLSAIDVVGGHAQAAALRYYYNWYVLTADLCRLAHISPRAGLAASTVWAAFDFFAVVFLALKYLAGITTRLYETSLAAIAATFVMGLDLLPALIMLVSPKIGMNLEMEWWHPDRSPSWPSTFLYAPHHIAGISCCMLGLLAVVVLARVGDRVPEVRNFGPGYPTLHEGSWSSKVLLLHAFVVGICFAAAVGTSTFVTLCFTLICAGWSLRAVLKRDWPTLAVFAGAAVLAYVLVRSFLHEMGAASGEAHGIAYFAVRNAGFVRDTLEKHHHAGLFRVAALPAIVLLLIAELGFFCFVLAHQLRADWLAVPPRTLIVGRTLTPGRQALWLVFGVAAACALFLSSAYGGPNDFGMHTAMIAKFVLLLWSAPLVERAWRCRHSFTAQTASRKLLLATATAAFALGFCGIAYQLAMERLLFPLEQNVLHKKMDTYDIPSISGPLSSHLYDIRDAYLQANALLPTGAVLQANPDSRLLPAYGLYATRQLAAGDSKCGVPFGGNEERCKQLYPELSALFGSGTTLIDQPLSPELFDRVCRDMALTALLADNTDPAWYVPQSWVNRIAPLYANSTVRLIACPNGTSNASHK